MWLNVVARLKPGMSRVDAETAMNAFWRPILQDELKEIKQPSASLKQRFLNRHLSLAPAANGISALRVMFRAPLLLLMALVALVLLIACANVANLMIARAAGRRKEVAIRLAVGASRGDIVRQILIESLILALAGGVAGVVLASWTGQLLLHLLPFGSLTSAISTDPDLRVLAFTGVVSILSGFLFGLAPALPTTRPYIVSTLKERATSVAGGSAQVICRKALVVVQVAVSLMLLIGAGLFLKSLGNLQDIDPGFRADHLTSFSVNPSLNGYDTMRAVSLFDRLIGRVRSLPGVSGAGISATPLLTGDDELASVEIPGHEPRESDETPNFDLVSPGFFRTLGITFMGGREFTDADAGGAPKVAIVNETFAHTYFGDDNPLGRHFKVAGDSAGTSIEIVGIVKTGKYADLREKKQGFIFCPYRQHYKHGAMTFYVRTSQQPEAISSALRQTVQEQDANLPLFDLKTMKQQIDESVFAERIVSGLSAVFGLLATMLASIGLYGVISYSVSRRTAEIGIRVALGADQRMVIGLVLREGAILVAAGALGGTAAAFGVSRLIANMLYGVSANDPVIFAGFTCLLLAVALLAIYIPARRAARLDPVIALRSE
jgi:predicted permease